jgi:glycosyltransferase involved in cell wall biosynthesis
VASVRDQDVPAEIIVVDDGATDSATVTAYERLETAGVRIIHQANQGPAPARMAGVRAARRTTSSRWTPTISWPRVA